jgi:hypothetical protein
METDIAIYHLLHNQYFGLLTAKMLHIHEAEAISPMLAKIMKYISDALEQNSMVYESTITDMSKMNKFNTEEIFDIFNARTVFNKFIVLNTISKLVVEKHLETALISDDIVFAILDIIRVYLLNEKFILNFVVCHNYKIIIDQPKQIKKSSWLKPVLVLIGIGLIAGCSYGYYNHKEKMSSPHVKR